MPAVVPPAMVGVGFAVLSPTMLFTAGGVNTLMLAVPALRSPEDGASGAGTGAAEAANVAFPAFPDPFPRGPWIPGLGTDSPLMGALEVPVSSSGRSVAVTVELGGSRKIGGRRTQEVLRGLLAGAVVDEAAGTLLKSASLVAPAVVAAGAGLSAWLEVSVPEVPGSAVTAAAAAAAALSSRRLSVFVL